MIRFLVLVWVAMALLGALAADAEAAAVNHASPTSDGMLYAAVAAADEWWAAQGARPCSGPVLDYDEGEDRRAVARGDTPGCTVYFERAYVRQQRRNLRRPWGVRWRRLVLQHVCMVAIHERGHNLGLGHDAGGVMSLEIAHPTLGHCVAWSIEKTPA